ncbi:hypothetical protein, partial [Cytobacillus firmus]|uniref:hypothetical protein n=1 Tax=Cytobacillus firmus TaxID=1399 RepID=UPI00203A60AB
MNHLFKFAANKKPSIMLMSPLSRHSKKPSCYHGGKNTTWRGFFLWQRKDKLLIAIRKSLN